MSDFISREAALRDFEQCNKASPRWTPQRVKTLLLRQPAADVAEVVHGRWISTKDRLPGNGDNYGWAHCIVSVFESISSPFTEDVNEREFVSTALFDVEQKIWHVGGNGELALNAMLDIEDSPSNGCFVSHWMPLPEEPADVYEVGPKDETTQIIDGCCTSCGELMDCCEAAEYKFCPYCAKRVRREMRRF